MKFISKQDYTEEAVKNEYPGAIIVEVEGGWAVFATVTDKETWQRQL